MPRDPERQQPDERNDLQQEAVESFSIGAEEIRDVRGYSVICPPGENIGVIRDYIFDEAGTLRYLVVDMGFWIFGRKILIPVGAADVDDDRETVYLHGLTKEEAEKMPPYDDSAALSAEYQHNLLEWYYPESTHWRDTPEGFSYHDYPEAFRLPDRLFLLKEQLRVEKRLTRQGDVSIGKKAETRRELVEIPVIRERLVIETRVINPATAETGETVTHTRTLLPLGDLNVVGETITIPLYKEQIGITRKTVPYQEVIIRKEQETVIEHHEVTLREETLELKAEGNLVILRETI